MITQDVQQLTPGNEIILFRLDLTNLGGGVLCFHGHLENGPIYWKGQQYDPWTIRAEGFEVTGTGQAPQPEVTVGNIGVDQDGNPRSGVISSICDSLQDLVGAEVYRIKTYSKYLDAVNFTEGNPSADPTQEFVESWLIGRKVDANPETVTFSLKSPMEFRRAVLPSRKIVADYCQWIEISGYRGPDCGYTGAMYTVDDKPTNDPVKDVCGGTLTSCKRRFGQYSELPIGCFPTADKVRGY